MASEILIEATLSLTAGLLLVLVLRRLVRRMFGAAAGYALWALVPVTLVAVLLPAPMQPVAQAMTALVVVPATPFQAVADTAGAPSLLAAMPWLWAAGSVLMVCWLGRQQQRFLADLGPLSARPDGFYQCLATRGLPAVVGLRPRIVLPGDFEQRYDAVERELVLAHESEHLRRGDLPACALALVLRTLFWFNPLVHLAATRFRHDQELACDAAVLRRYPHRRRLYGDAMLKTRLADQPLPLGCHWSGFHPLKERLAMLKNPMPSRRRRVAGLAVVLASTALSAALAWAAQPGSAGAKDGARSVSDMQAAVKAEGVTARAAALRIAKAAGLTIQNPEALDDNRLILLDFKGTPPRAALALLGFEDGLEPRYEGTSVRYVPDTPSSDNGMSSVGIEGAAPAYPKSAADAGQGGMVMLNVLVGADGRAVDVSFVPEKSNVAADSEFVRTTMEAAAGWKFQPAMEDGKPVKSRVLVPVRFDPPAAKPAGDEA